MKGALHTPFSVAAYIRLSREDGDKAESDSIGNQRKLIADFLKGKEEFILYEIYVDDGFSGTNFERPAFRRMIADIEAGKVNCVIVRICLVLGVIILIQGSIWSGISRTIM